MKKYLPYMLAFLGIILIIIGFIYS